MQIMNVLLVLLIVAAVIATVVALIRGIVAFLKETEADLKNGGPSPSGLRQNRMMMARVMFQAIAVLLVAVLLLFNR